MRHSRAVMFALCAIALGGCYSSARHVANVRPDIIKPDKTFAAKYKLERIVLKKSSFSRMVETSSSLSQKDRDRLLKEDRKSGPKGTHYADTQMMFNSVRDALARDYPSVFTDAANAIPIAVVIDWATEYKQLPDYASIFSGWLWPVSAEQESVYHLYVVENPGNKTDYQLWNAYISAPKKYPLPPGCGFATRKSEVWESALVLPTGFIPCPGESDFPKTFCFMRCGKDSLVEAPAQKIESRKCFRHMVFEPKVDGDVIAAAIMRVLNRKHRMSEAARMVNGGAK